ETDRRTAVAGFAVWIPLQALPQSGTQIAYADPTGGLAGIGVAGSVPVRRGTEEAALAVSALIRVARRCVALAPTAVGLIRMARPGFAVGAVSRLIVPGRRS